MDRLSSSLAAGGVLGAAARLVADPRVTHEMFKDSDSSSVGIGFVIFIVLLVVTFAIMFFYSVYSIVPSNKGLHLAGSLFLGGLWFVPMLFYFAYNGYELRKLGF